MQSLQNLSENVKPVCNQATVLALAALVLVAKSLYDGNYVTAVVVLVHAALSIMILNCLCRSGCEGLAWIYALFHSSTFLVATGYLPKGFEDMIRSAQTTEGRVDLTRAYVTSRLPGQ
jgi:hypothetical protein